MDKKMTQKLEVMCSECMGIWENDDVDVSIQSRALRLYADIFEDMAYLDYEKASRAYIRAIIKEYDQELTKLYGEF